MATSWADNLLLKTKWSWRDWLKFTAIMLYWSAVTVVGVVDIIIFLILWVNGFQLPHIQLPFAP